MIDDARVVLEWLGRTQEPPPTFEHNGGNSWTRTEGRFKIDFRIDANWIIEKLVDALRERLGLRYGAFWPLSGGETEVSVSTPDAMYRGTGPTFEAAFLAAAAAAIRGTSDDR